MARTRRSYFTSRYAEDALVIPNSEVIKFDYQNKEVQDKLKTCFYCKSKTRPEGRMCIAWGRTTFEVGDMVTLTGRFKDDVFLVWSLMYTRKEK